MSYYSNSLHHAKTPPKKLEIKLFDTILNNKSFSIKVSYWSTIQQFKQLIERSFGIPVTQQRLFYKTQELQGNNFNMLAFENKKKIKLTLRQPPNLGNNFGVVKRFELLPKSQTGENLIFQIQEGFNIGLIPKLTFDGTSGTYFLRNRYHKRIGIFKPFDEEPFAPNNPKDYKDKLGTQGFRPGILSGEAAVREVCAYLLDYKKFAGVPYTTFVEVVHPYFSNREMKEAEINENTKGQLLPIENFSQYVGENKKLISKHGSLQQFVDNAEEAGDYGPGMFSDEDVRKIAILDLRLINCDRNEGNILVKKEKGKCKLIPIDHGLILPSVFEACTYDLIWMDWEHVEQPWTEEELEYLSKINPKEDVLKLTKYFKFRDVCLRNFRIAQTTLKKFAFAGLTIKDVGEFMYREDPEIMSPLEEIIKKTEEFNSAIQSTGIPTKKLNGNQSQSSKKYNQAKSFEEEKTSNGNSNGHSKELIYDTVQEQAKFGGKRGRTRSENLEIFDDDSDHPFNDIIKQNISENTNGLPTIPELTSTASGYSSGRRSKPNSIVKSHHKFSFNSKTSSREQSREYSSDEEFIEEEEENDHEDKDGLGLSLKNLKPRRATSIPAQLTKTNGLDMDYKKSQDSSQITTTENGNGQKLHKVLTQKKKGTYIPPQFDENFFKYFENFLEQKIRMIIKCKKQPNSPTRPRFMSEQLK